MDFAAPRLFLRAPLAADARVELDRDQMNYLVNVLRLRDHADILVFNGSDGEWHAKLASIGRRVWALDIATQARPQTPAPDLRYLFAPLKQARLDYMIQKAVEMGAGRLTPVITRHTQITRVNRDRVEANAIEAAEQCGILSIPKIDDPLALPSLLDGWDSARRIIFCDEGDGRTDPVALLSRLPPSPLAVLVGPEGGFAEDERQTLRALPFVTAIPLGPRILRADTAAVAAFVVVQAILGDWRNGPSAPHSA